jgi:CheY-like chemotaxis protein
MNLQMAHVKSILIIDDDPDDFELVFEAVQRINPTIKVKYIQNCDDVARYRKEHFDLVLLDINMPEHDGFYWLKAIREHGYHDLPVIMYTNSLSPANITKAYSEGANLYFAKPETFSNLIKGFEKLVNMDWSSPYAITKQYSHHGSYQTFQVE